MKSWGDTILGDAEQFLREGRIDEARPLLVAHVQKDPSSARGWWLLSMALSDTKQQIDCLERVLRIEPNNAPARTRLSKLKGGISPRPFSAAIETSPPVKQEPPRSFAPFLPEDKQDSPPPHSEPAKKKRSWVLPVSILSVCLFAAAGIVGLILVLRARQQAAPSFIAQPTQSLPGQGLPPAWTPTAASTPTSGAISIPVETPFLALETLPPDPGTIILQSKYGLPIGTAAPDFALENVATGRQERLSSYRGRPVILFFFAANQCSFCDFEAAELQNIYEEYQNDDLVILGINMGGFALGRSGGLEQGSDYRESLGLTYSILNDWEAAAFNLYKGDGFPINYFVDQNGVIVAYHRGSMGYSMINIQVRIMLGLIPTPVP
jgi:peroxiredoxin